ncbi:tyrosine-type recombinase/integrase [Paraliobacillus sp. JSM ZJ581]|uniref:tyrosine-type recombinase/integrase n=1 Tax=Paraliobacillus sp. JSM ZJ581 TaxID=3342118 RepID=UPI0035A860D7
MIESYFELARDDLTLKQKEDIAKSILSVYRLSLPIHSLRHAHAVLLLEAENDMKFIQERLGHRSYQITADIYSHISKRLDQKSMKRYEAYLGQITSSKSD